MDEVGSGTLDVYRGLAMLRVRPDEGNAAIA
jgi:hypothetical protein